MANYSQKYLSDNQINDEYNNALNQFQYDLNNTNPNAKLEDYLDEFNQKYGAKQGEEYNTPFQKIPKKNNSIDKKEKPMNWKSFNNRRRYFSDEAGTAGDSVIESLNNPYSFDYYKMKNNMNYDPIYDKGNAFDNKDYHNYLINLMADEYAKTGNINPVGFSQLQSLGNQKETDPLNQFYSKIGLMNKKYPRAGKEASILNKRYFSGVM